MSQPEFPSESRAYPEQSQATTALVLGILSLVVCGILAPFAWSIGNKELAAIDAGLRAPENRGTANAGRILGIIGTALLGIGLLFLLVVFVLIAVGTVASWNDVFT
jgi:TRAP-type C4-dicarboxylate transport system permease small subunit